MSDISELFARDPEQLSDKDLDQIVAHLQSLRSQFMLGAKSAGSMKPTKKAEKVTSLNIDDLGL